MSRTLGRIDASRCSVCRHPDREALDLDLVLRRRSQSEVARLVGLDRSTVSRHVKNHVMPALAEGVIMDTKDVALGNLVEAFDRIYAETWVLYERASMSGDLRLAASLLDSLRRVVEVVVKYASNIGQLTLQDVVDQDPATQANYWFGIQDDLVARLDDLYERHKRGIRRPTQPKADDGSEDGESTEARDQDSKSQDRNS